MSVGQMGPPRLHAVASSSWIRTRLKIHCFYQWLGRTDYIPRIILWYGGNGSCNTESFPEDGRLFPDGFIVESTNSSGHSWCEWLDLKCSRFPVTSVADLRHLFMAKTSKNGKVLIYTSIVILMLGLRLLKWREDCYIIDPPQGCRWRIWAI